MSGIIPLSMQDLAAHSRFVQRLRRRYADDLALLPPGVPTPSALQAAYEALRPRHDEAAALRILRQLVMARLAQLDCQRQASLAEITQAVTDLAEFALETALRIAQDELDLWHGPPRAPDGH